MYVTMLDENLVEIDQLTFNSFNIKNLKKSEGTPDIDEFNKELLNKLDYSVTVYSPTERLDDFYISYLNTPILRYCPFSLEDVQGIHLSTIFPNNKESILIKKMMKVYTTDKSQRVYFEYYKNDILYRRYDIKIIKVRNFIYFLSKDTNDYSSAIIEENNLFENDVTGIVIVQNNCFVKCNKKYLELFEHEKYDDVIGKKLGYSTFVDDSMELIQDTVQKVLKEKLPSYTIQLETKKNNKFLRYFNITCNYIVYNGEPAVLGIFNNITQQELTKRERDKKAQEASFLEENLELIQSATDTGIAYLFNGKIIRSSKLYEIIEREHYDEDLYRDITDDFVIDEDKHILKENYKKLRLTHKNVDFIIRIKTAKGNLKHIHCYINVTYNNNNNPSKFISFYKDVTEEQKYINDLKIALDNSLKLKSNLETIQRISKTAMSYTNDEGTLEWTPTSFEMIKVNPKDYEDYHGTFFEFVLEEDIPRWYAAYKKCSPESPETSTLLRVLDGEGNLIYVITYIVCSYDEKDNETGHVNFFQDITEQIERENELKEALKNSQQLERNLEKIQKISKTSMSYINDKTKEVTWFIKGYNMIDIPPEKYSDTMIEYILPEDQNIWKEAHAKCNSENPETTFIQRIISDSKEIKYIHTYVAYEFDKKGNKIGHINFFQDITEEIGRENKLKEALAETLKLQNNLNRIRSLSKTAVGYKYKLDHVNWTPEIYSILEIDPKKYINKNIFIEDFIVEEDLDLRNRYISKLSPQHPDVQFNQRVKTGKGNIKYLRTIIHNEYDFNGKLIDRISFNQDITREVKYQNQLENALKDKEVLLTEVHHRVKNNLQIILSLINLNKSFDSEHETILNDTENRIYAMALIHEKIYVSESLSNVDMKEYIESLVQSLFDMYQSNIEFHHNMKSIELNMEEAIPIGLIINELVTNSIKYAFPNHNDGNLYIDFKRNNNKYTIIVKDDGIGLPDDFDLDTVTSMGLLVVQNLMLQLGGTITIIDCEGTEYKLEFEEE